jgi:hypothetical protein
MRHEPLRPALPSSGRPLRTGPGGFVRCVLLLVILIAGSLSPPLAAQAVPAGATQESARGFVLEPNTPNPVERETWIPFVLDESLFVERDSVRVSMRIYNVLRQLVAVPELVREGRGRRPPLESVALSETGRKLAYWDARDLNGRRVPSGVYYVELVVDGARHIGKMIVVNPERRRPRILPWFGERGDRPR